jgi:AcrR family transcriptional regulator
MEDQAGKQASAVVPGHIANVRPGKGRKRGSIDRRAARTRRALHYALFSLAQERPYEAITVEAICKAAGVGRSTFYAHFADKDALKRNGVETLRGSLDEAAEEPLGFSLMLFRHGVEHLEHFRALGRGPGREASIQTLTQLVRRAITTDAVARRGQRSEQAPTVEFLTSGYIGLLTWWLDRGAPEAPELMDAIFRRFAGERPSYRGGA